MKDLHTILRRITIFLFCVFLFSHYDSWAQQIVHVSVIQKSTKWDKNHKKILKDEQYPSESYVVGFLDQNQAIWFYNQVKDGNIPEAEFESIAQAHGGSWQRTDEQGKAIIKGLLPNSKIVCIPLNGADPKIQENKQGECNFVFIHEYSEALEKELDEVLVKEEFKSLPPDTIAGEIIGKDIFRRRSPFAISPYLAKDNARFGLTPIFIAIEDPKDTLCFYRPFVKEGRNFHTTQSRRMDFDAPQHDTLSHKRSLDTTYLHNHVLDTLWFQWHVRKRDVNRHYRVLANYWCEDYNGAFFRDTIQIDHGRNINRLRFLDFKMDSMHIEIDKTRYHIEGKVQERNENLSLRLEFVYSKADLRPDSKSNYYEIRRLLREFGSIYRGGSEGNSYLNTQSVMAVGVASPDGREAGNRNLALRRANTVGALIRDSLSYHDHIIYRDSIAPWSAVADTLLEMGDTLKAMEIREIVRKFNNLDQQSIAVQNSKTLNYYGFLKDQVMPKFCVVKFSYRYLVKKILDKEDIIDKYEHDPEFRERDNKEHYQYEALFDYLKDRLPELEEQSKKAYYTLKEQENENMYNRPWPLAAYVYANTLLKKGHTDLDEEPYEGILWPFLKLDYVPKGTETAQRRRDHHFTQWWNDEAIVATMVGMYFQSGDILKARLMAANYFNKNLLKTKYKELKVFLDCYLAPDNIDIINAVAKTSTFNKAVIYAAQDEKRNPKALPYLRSALNILQGPEFSEDHRAVYLRAILKYRLNGPSNGLVGVLTPFIDENMSKSQEELEEEREIDKMDFRLDSLDAAKNGITMNFQTYMANKNKQFYGIDMVKACQMNPGYLEVLKWDGYFSDSYRKAFFFYWKRKNEGLTDEEIKDEWVKERDKNGKK